MEEAYARRALLLHLGSVLQILSRLEGAPDNQSIEALLAANGMLADVPLVEYVVQDMTVREFSARALRAFCLWPHLLREDPLDCAALALPVRKHLFAGNDAGWKAYAATLREVAPGFDTARSYAAEPHEAEFDLADERDAETTTGPSSETTKPMTTAACASERPRASRARRRPARPFAANRTNSARRRPCPQPPRAERRSIVKVSEPVSARAASRHAACARTVVRH